MNLPAELLQHVHVTTVVEFDPSDPERPWMFCEVGPEGAESGRAESVIELELQGWEPEHVLCVVMFGAAWRG